MATKSKYGVNSKSDKMFLLMKEFENSGQTQRSFRQAHGVKRSTFQYWLRRYRQSKQESASAQAGFVPLAVRPAGASPSAAGLACGKPPAAEGIVITYRDGTRVEVHTPVGASFIRQLLGH
jgi:hypothetical protein